MKRSISKQIQSIDFDLRQLEVFSKVVDLKSFSKAAEAVFLAQASVSERIATLESTVGTRLLDRLGRQVVPTKAGELLYKHAVLLLDMKRAATQEIQDFLGVKRGEIHIGGSTIPGEYILPKVLRPFQKKYPLISVALTVADTKEIEGRVLESNLELGVIGSRSSQKNIIHDELWHDELVLALPAEHRWADKNEISVEALSKEPFIMREAGSGTLRIMEEYLHAYRSEGIGSLNIVAYLGTSTAVKEGIKAGLGVSILSSRAMETEIKAGVLKPLKIKGLSMYRNFYLIRDKRRIMSPLCQAMLDFLKGTSDQ
jgi:DNA-binding transcriptional LysR family regulator